jgi:two-component system chemotaxis sensor kinase CheA
MATPQDEPALQGLLAAISAPVDRNDLGRLARMHSFCQALAAYPPAGSDHQAVQQLAGGLITLLEKIILDETVRPDEAVAVVSPAVQALADACTGKPTNVDELLARINFCLGLPSTAPSAAPAPPPAAAPQPPPPPPEPAAVTPSAPETAAPAYVSEPLVIDLSETEHLRGFIEESQEHLATIESALLEVERDPTNTEKINELFRPFHTIKGIAGFLNLRDINRLTHEVETILDLGRKGTLAITSTIVDRIFAAVDLLKVQIAELSRFLANPQGNTCPQPDISTIIAELAAIHAQKSSAAAAPPGSAEPAESPIPGRPRTGEVLIAQGAVHPDDVFEALDVQRQSQPRRPLGQILVELGATSQKQVEKALQTQATSATVAEQSIRVDTAKLDALVDMVGELVIAQTMLNLSAAAGQDDRLQRNVSQVSKIVREVQEAVMSMRMVPIGPTLAKMRRLVRDLSRKAGKKVELRISGEDTELDKTVIQQISDPLVHMVRNAIDHGIEEPALRRQLGKPETGHIYLNAFHQGDSIVITVADDGRGLSRQRIIEKACQRGLISQAEAAQLTDQQIFDFILAPGFSTAEKVTDISGRGVGMDVVKRNVEQLRGKLEIQSQEGRGTTFIIRLPLTLAIIDGMVVRVGRERLIIPTILIEQALRPQRSQITTVQQRGEVLAVRGTLYPLIQLAEIFGYGPRIDPTEALVVIVQCENQRVGLIVDELIGQQQVVIKALSGRLKRIEGISGAAILGDGRVGLILEPAGLLRLHRQRPASLPAATLGPGATVIPENAMPSDAVPTAREVFSKEPVVSAAGARHRGLSPAACS